MRRTIHNVRAAAALAPVRPAWGAGLRAAVATVAPLVVGQALGAGAGTWLSLAGFTVALSDRGGSYHSRAVAMGALTLGAATTAALGALGYGRLWLAVPLTFAVAVAGSVARVWGSAGAGFGVAVLNTLVISLAIPGEGAGEPLRRAGYVIVGGLWAMLLSLALWPLRPYRPARLAAAAAYRALAQLADDIARRTRAPVEPRTVDLPPGLAAVRLGLENAGAVIAALRRGRPGETGRGESLVVLRETADQLFGHLVALMDTVDAIPGAARDPAAQEAIGSAVQALAATARQIADAVEAERGSPAVSVSWTGGPLRERALASDGPAAARPHYEHAALVLDRLAQYARVSGDTATALNSGAPVAPLTGVVHDVDPAAPSLGTQLRAVLSLDSQVLRYGLRLGIVTAVAVWLPAALQLKHGYWVTITAVIILQPYTGATTLRALQRVVGTVLGAMLAAGLGALFHDARAIVFLAFPFTVISVALLPVNYAAFSVFLTPTFVLLAEASAGDWHLAGVRVIDTLIGGALALVGARLLWPARESAHLPTHLAAAVRVSRDYLRAVSERFGDRSDAAGQALREARRRAGLAVTNAEDSFQRLLGEHRGPAEELGPLMTLLTYSRRFVASVAALSLARHSADGSAEALVRPFVAAADRALDDLASAVADGRSPGRLPPEIAEAPADPGLSPIVRASVERLSRQVQTLHDAAERWADGGAATTAERAAVAGVPARAAR
ncbi:MAG TPA: FUSC family protein [Gemmatimonadaceae bacterium]|nr:FUSC family protein [Gemmatimonadaceae bacterium]